MKELLEKYNKATNRLILLDYDGTLVDFHPEPGAAILPDRLYRLLTSLMNDPANEVYIITGRSNTDIDRLLNNLTVGIVAEHGAAMKLNGEWKDKISDPCLWKSSVLPLMNRAVQKCPGSFVEEKRFSLAWHYRNSDQDPGDVIASELIDSVSRLNYPAHLKILDGNKVIEILNSSVGKGKAVTELLKTGKFDFVLSIGDDVTDEEMFETLSDIPNAFTVKIGNGDTKAMYKFRDIPEVERLLEQITK